jgi:predicted DNA-binding transcriptional regulator YafY
MKIDRLLSIIMILLEKDKVSAPELAKMFDVSVRTIYRDLDVIDQTGIPIVTAAGVNGGVGIMETYKLEKRLFTTNDIITLLMGLGSIRSLLSAEDITGLLSKIKALPSKDQLKKIELKAGQISIDLSPWSGSRSCVNQIEAIQTAMNENRLICFSYLDWEHRRSDREVEPYRLLLKNMSWYVEGYCLVRQDYRLFKLTRMIELSVSKQKFSPREFVPRDLPMDLPDQDKIIMGTIRVSESGRERILDLFGDEYIEKENENTWLAHIPISDNERGYRFILGLGSGCECVEPAYMRDKIRKYIEKILETYFTPVITV